MSTVDLPELVDECMIMYDGKRYVLIYEPNFDFKDPEAGPYQVVNKTTGVVEFENKVLAGVLEMMLKFDLGLDMYEKQLEEIVATTTPVSKEDIAQTNLELARHNIRITPVDESTYRQISEEEFEKLFNDKKDE